MPDYRTPEEDRAQLDQYDRVRPVLDQAVADSALVKAAMVFGLPAEAVEPLIDRVWDGLRDGLDREDRIAAILLLLDPRADAEYRAMAPGLGHPGGEVL